MMAASGVESEVGATAEALKAANEARKTVPPPPKAQRRTVVRAKKTAAAGRLHPTSIQITSTIPICITCCSLLTLFTLGPQVRKLRRRLQTNRQQQRIPPSPQAPIRGRGSSHK